MLAAAIHILCLLPLTAQIMRRDPQRDIWLFASVCIAAVGTVIVLGLSGEELQSRGFTAALHWSELSVILIFGGLAMCKGPKQIWRLAGYIGAYLVLFGGVAAGINMFEPFSFGDRYRTCFVFRLALGTYRNISCNLRTCDIGGNCSHGLCRAGRCAEKPAPDPLEPPPAAVA